MINDNRLPLKEKFLVYFKDVPMQRFASMYIGRDEDTISRWKNEDTDFAERIANLKAEYVQNNLKDVKNIEWRLERMFKQEFAQRTEVTGADGKDLPTPILGTMNVQSDLSNKETTPTK
jgi:hypothetical protein